MTLPLESEQLEELTQSIFQMAVLNFDTPPKVHGNGALDAIAAALVALGEELKATVVAKKEAENANMAKGNFIAKISHELRTPLTTIVCSSELLKETVLSKQQERLINNINNASSLLLRHINDILDFSNTSRDRVSIIETPVQVVTTIRQCIDKHSVAAIEKGIELSLQYAGPENLVVLCDEFRLQQVLMNVISNSLKFTNSGRILIKLSTHTIGDEESITLEIEDSGIGMDIETVDMAFEPFFSRDSSIRRKYGGAGLGLTITRSILDAMGGDISLRSRLGIGTVVAISLKFKRVNVFLKKQNDHHDLALKGKKVLIVDDTPLVAEVIKAMLEGLGLSVDLLTSGLEVLSAPFLNEYNIIFMDCQMPGLDGLQTTTKLLSVNPNADLRIIALSAHNSDEFIEECHNAGMVHHLSKPCTMESLKQTIIKFSK